MNSPEHIFWDSCVFIRYLTESPSEYVDDIARFITDAKNGTRKIYLSTIAYTEIRPRYLKPEFGSVQDFFSTWERAFIPIDPNPNILTEAGKLRDVTPIDPSNPTTNTQRVLGTPDSIHLMTCIYLREVLGINDIVFHTFDNGRGKTWEGKCVPILDFQEWYPDALRNGNVGKVCGLERTRPIYPDADLYSGKPDGW